MIGNIGFTELLVIALIVLVFFGPRRLPEIGSSLGKAIREFKRGVNEIQREFEDIDRDASPARDAQTRRPAERSAPDSLPPATPVASPEPRSAPESAERAPAESRPDTRAQGPAEAWPEEPAAGEDVDDSRRAAG